MASLRSPTAKKLFNPIQDPPSASSSDDNEISDSSSEENEPKIPSTQTLKSPSAVSAAAKPDSESDNSGSGSDSESEPPEKALPVTAVKSKKKEGNDSPAVKSVKKRGNEAGTSTEVNAKRAKKVSGAEEKKSGENNKKPLFQRLWSEEDEITLLQGMIDFKAETGTSHSDDMNGFYDKVKKFISFDVSKSQFSDKIRGLKKKYFAGKKKSVESSHDKKCLGLVKYIYGSDSLGLESDVKPKKVESDVKPKKVESDVVVKPKKVESDVVVKPKKVESDVVVKPKKVESDAVVKPKKVESDAVVKPKKVESDAVVKFKGKGKKVESKVEEDEDVVNLGGDLESSSWFETSFLVRLIASLGVDECSVKQRWSKVPLETKKKLEENFKSVEAKDYELLLMKADLLKEVTSVISEAV